MQRLAILVLIVNLAFIHVESTKYLAAAESGGEFYKIATIEDHPWVIKNETCMSQTTGQEDQTKCYRGFLIDLVDKIKDDLKFNYTIIEKTEFGHPDTTKSPPEWTGLIGEITNGNADIALAALNITDERKAAIEFSVPFINEPKNNKTFALGFPKNSSAKAAFNHMITKLTNQRHIEQLVEVYFVESVDFWSKEKALTKYKESQKA